MQKTRYIITYSNLQNLNFRSTQKLHGFSKLEYLTYKRFMDFKLCQRIRSIIK